MSKLFSFSTRLRTACLVVFAAACAMVLSRAAEAARVRGTLRELNVEFSGKLLGFTRTRVAAPAESIEERRLPVALFLAVKNGESYPIPAPTEHQIITIDGLRFTPNIASCASDAQVSFVNADREPVTLTVDGRELGTIAPGAQKTYVCSPGQPNRVVRVVEWPHMRAAVYVGDIGVADVPNERGRFAIEAPRGTYELRVVAKDGVVLAQDVTIEKRDVDLGRLEVAGPEDGTASNK